MIMSVLKKYTRYLTCKPFDTATSHGREEERYRLAAWASLASLFSNAMAMLGLLVTVPLTLRYLGAERFGVWMTLYSAATVLSFLDLGIGNGLVNYVARAHATKNHRELGALVTFALMLLTGVGFGIWLLTSLVAVQFPLDSVIKLKGNTNIDEIRWAAYVFLCVFSVSIPLGAIGKVFQGMQMAWKFHIVTGVGAACSIVAVYLLANERVELVSLVLATYGIQTFFLIFLVFELVRQKILRVANLQFEQWKKMIAQLFHSGGIFLLLQIGVLIMWNIDSLIIASTLGVASVATFALVQRLFQIILVPLSIINSPLWVAYADAQIKMDYGFIRKTLLRSLLITTFLATIGTVAISTFSHQIFSLWTHGVIAVSESLVWCYGVMVVMMAVGNAFAMFINGMGELRIQLITVCLFCSLAIALKYYLLDYYGMLGLVLATIFAYILAVFVPYATIFRKKLSLYLT